MFLRVLFLSVVCLVASSCQKPTAFTPELPDAEINSEEQAQQKMVDEIKSRGGLPKAWKNHKNMRPQFERVGGKIEEAGAEICRLLKLQERGCYYYFSLNRSDELNSHADGKKVVIYTGMMRFTQNDDELAVVMGHEFAHNLMGHVQAQKNNGTIGMLLGGALDAIATSQGVSTQSSGAELGKEVAVMSYSVDFEQEADYVGLYIMARAGYDIRRAPNFWRRMSLENPEEIYTNSTHPSNAARFVALQKAIYEVEYKRKHHLPILPDFKANVSD